VLDVVGRIDRQDGEPPAYRILTPCCRHEQELSAWVITSVRAYNPDRIYVVPCFRCLRWTPVEVPAVSPHA
jgi:hypothetical protein